MPQTRATVLTIQTALPQAKRSLAYEIVIAGNRARSMNEMDRWRLIDFNKNSVTFVDEIAKTYRTESIAALVQRRRETDAGRPPDHAPQVQIAATGATKTIQGVNARQYVITVAPSYKRDLWVGEHPSIPSNLFAVLHTTEDVISPFAPMMRSVDEAIIALKGFPLAEHAELPYGDSKMILDRVVARIEEKNVPESWLNVPQDYKEITAPAAGRPPASLPRSRQRTPAAESPPSSTTQKNP